jgi:UDP-N-acetylmuramoyl-tripeptide--D-alanyl-D-alanine ligase
MLRNAALAAVAALLAGAREADIRAAAARWRPSPGRGEILLRGGRLFYVDCYNANPDSMLDAARAFDRRTTTPTATATTGIGENKNATANEPPEGAGRGNADINEPPASVGRGNADANEPPGSTGRVFVLGGMNELGPDSILWHERVGRALPLRRGDRLFLFGGDSPAIGAGAVAAGFPETAVRRTSDIAELREWLAATTGAVFLKASRTHALERALPPADRAK